MRAYLCAYHILVRNQHESVRLQRTDIVTAVDSVVFVPCLRPTRSTTMHSSSPVPFLHCRRYICPFNWVELYVRGKECSFRHWQQPPFIRHDPHVCESTHVEHICKDMSMQFSSSIVFSQYTEGVLHSGGFIIEPDKSIVTTSIYSKA